MFDMKKRVLVLGLLVLGMSASRGAFADEGQDTGMLWGVGFATLDLGLATTDLVAGARGTWAPRGYAAAEVAAAGAQIAICIDKALSPPPGLITTGGVGPSGSVVGWELGAAVGAVFVAHGIATLVAPRSHTETTTPSGAVTITPLTLSDVSRAAVPGMAVLGHF
jgi:hypothetical protein